MQYLYLSIFTPSTSAKDCGIQLKNTSLIVLPLFLTLLHLVLNCALCQREWWASVILKSREPNSTGQENNMCINIYSCISNRATVWPNDLWSQRIPAGEKKSASTVCHVRNQIPEQRTVNRRAESCDVNVALQSTLLCHLHLNATSL